MVKWLHIAVIAALAGSVSCAAPQREAVEMTMETHSGLQFGVPAGRVVSASDTMIELNPEALLRSVDEIVIWTAPPPPLPDGTVSEGDDPAPHTLVTIEGGMGGPEYALSIPKQVGGRTVTVRAYIQSEDGQPQFADAWAVWRSLAEDKSPSPD
jgi:hypothetical protein